MPECIMLTHPKEVFTVHACLNEDREIIKASLFMKHFHEWDQNLDPHILIEQDEEFVYPIPLVTMDNDKFQEQLLSAKNIDETMLVLLDWGAI